MPDSDVSSDADSVDADMGLIDKHIEERERMQNQVFIHVIW